MKHFISVTDATQDEFQQLLKLTEELKYKRKNKIPFKPMQDKTLGMIFTKSSTRTRVSFEVGTVELGGYPLFLSSADIQLGRGETIYDTANVLSRFVDGIMIRTYAHQDVLDLAKYGQIPIINGLTDYMHPCQAMADLFTVYEHKGKLEGLKMSYIGDGNNVTHSLLHACAMAGMDMSVATPVGYECAGEIVEEAKEIAKKTGSKITITNDPIEAISGSDAVYTDTWVSMGQEAEKAERIKIFEPYQIDKNLFSHAKEDAIFMHCLPAYRGLEVTEDVIDSPSSVIFDEAENRLHAQKAIMTMLMGD